MQVTLNVPVTPEDIKGILSSTNRQDLDVTISEQFKDKLDTKFTPVTIIKDDHGH